MSLRPLIFLTFFSVPYIAFTQIKIGSKILRMGIFVHYLHDVQNKKEPWNLGKQTSWDSCVNEFNVDTFANQVQRTGADYVIFTLQQQNQYFCIPEPLFEKRTGYKRGEATSHRDLVNDLYIALNKKKISLFLYITGDGPARDIKAAKALNNPSVREIKDKKNDFWVDDIWVNSWAEILTDISLRYKTKITGWWVDGCYDFIGYNDKLLSKLKKALKTGNPNALVALNNAPKDTVKKYSIEDFTAGESDWFKNTTPKTFKGAYWHTLSYLGNTWGEPDVRYNASDLATYIKNCNKNKGMVSIDVAVFRDGRISPPQLQTLIQTKKKL